MTVLEFNRTDLPQAGMPPLRVVPSRDPREDRRPRLDVSPPYSPVNEFAFERCFEPLCHRIVVCVSHGAMHVLLLAGQNIEGGDGRGKR